MQNRQIIGGENRAIGIDAIAVGVIGAAAGLDIEVLACDIGVMQFTGIFIFKFHHTAATTAIAKRFPF